MTALSFIVMLIQINPTAAIKSKAYIVQLETSNNNFDQSTICLESIVI